MSQNLPRKNGIEKNRGYVVGRRSVNVGSLRLGAPSSTVLGLIGALKVSVTGRVVVRLKKTRMVSERASIRRP